MPNPMNLLHMRERLELFNTDHPRVMPFLKAVGETALQEGSVLEVKVTTPDGREYVTNIRLNQNDLETIEMAKKAK